MIKCETCLKVDCIKPNCESWWRKTPIVEPQKGGGRPWYVAGFKIKEKWCLGCEPSQDKNHILRMLNLRREGSSTYTFDLCTLTDDGVVPVVEEEPDNLTSEMVNEWLQKRIKDSPIVEGICGTDEIQEEIARLLSKFDSIISPK
jgi:hypothetical protein